MPSRMRTTMFSRAPRTAIAGLCCGALLPLLDTSCQQPPALCTTAHVYYVAEFELKKGDPNSECGKFTHDILGMNTYFATGGVNGTPKFREASMAIRSQYAGIVFENAAHYTDQKGDPVPVPGLEDDRKDPNDYDHMPNALGKFDNPEPDGEDFCHAKKVGPAVTKIPELPALPEIPPVLHDPPVPDDPETPDVDESIKEPGYPAVEATPPITITHEWTNARWLVSANYQGTQFEADLKLTINDCVAEYHVVALAPETPCMSDDDCRGEGVGINPDFAVKCNLDLDDPYNGIADVPDDPETPENEAQNWGLCVLAKDIPSFID